MVAAGAFSILGAWFYRHALRAERPARSAAGRVVASDRVGERPAATRASTPSIIE